MNNPMHSVQTPAPAMPASLLRRLAALVYDAVLLCAILLVASVPPVLLNGGPFRDGSDFGDFKNALYFLYLLGIVFLFYGWFWTHNGQTLGMAAWRIRVVSQQNSVLNWKQALIRFATALFGLANLWICLDPLRLGWHERLSGSRTLYIPKSPR